jgi:iron complex transport system ATP-binding protein
MNALHTHDLVVGYRRPPKRVAAQLNLSLDSGELVCLIGPNGAGKSTLLRTLAGMQPPLNGAIMLGGQDALALSPAERARLLSIVLTERVDLGGLSARELVALGRHPYTDWTGRLSADDWAVVDQAVRAVGAGALAARQFRELSDGERQKIMIARALAQEPSLLLLDEPTAFLDLPRRVEIMRLLRSLAHVQSRAVLVSTHDLDLALRSADRLWLLHTPADEDESILVDGAPEDLVLNGALEAAFSGVGVQFDAHTGSFRLHTELSCSVALDAGDDLRAAWTRRALERAGFRVVNGNEAQSHIRVESDEWFIDNGTTTQRCASLYALIQRLREHR